MPSKNLILSKPWLRRYVFWKIRHTSRGGGRPCRCEACLVGCGYIQKLRRTSRWILCDAWLKAINNFARTSRHPLNNLVLGSGQFHDLRKMALSNWFANGLRENDVRVLANHASFVTTQQFYLAVANDLLECAREAAAQGIGRNLVCTWGAPCFTAPKD